MEDLDKSFDVRSSKDVLRTAGAVLGMTALLAAMGFASTKMSPNQFLKQTPPKTSQPNCAPN